MATLNDWLTQMPCDEHETGLYNDDAVEWTEDNGGGGGSGNEGNVCAHCGLEFTAEQLKGHNCEFDV